MSVSLTRTQTFRPSRLVGMLYPAELRDQFLKVLVSLEQFRLAGNAAWQPTVPQRSLIPSLIMVANIKVKLSIPQEITDIFTPKFYINSQPSSLQKLRD